MLGFLKSNPKARSLVDDLAKEYQAAETAIRENDDKIKKLLVAPLSRAETMRIMTEIVAGYSEKLVGAELDNRIRGIWNSDFDINGENADHYRDQANPILHIGSWHPNAFLLEVLLSDAILGAVFKRVEALIPASVSLTAAQKKSQLRALQGEGERLSKLREDALTAYRRLMDDRGAIPGVPAKAA